MAAAAKIKASVPGVIPLWFLAGAGSGANGLLQGINNFIVGTATPKIQADTAGNKWVVDSPGIRAAMALLKQVIGSGLRRVGLAAVQSQRGDHPAHPVLPGKARDGGRLQLLHG